jgi:hypothetical protein
MSNFIAANCVYLDKTKNCCRHANHARSLASPLRWLGCSVACVFAWPSQEAVTCREQEERPIPAPPRSWRSAVMTKRDDYWRSKALEGQRHTGNMLALLAERDAEILRLRALLGRWVACPEVTEIDPKDRDPDTEQVWRETRIALENKS